MLYFLRLVCMLDPRYGSPNGNQLDDGIIVASTLKGVEIRCKVDGVCGILSASVG